MRHEIRISGRLIGASAPPFVIAEMSGNHNQSLERALEIVDEAAKTGAHALKIQTYTPDTMTLDLDVREFHIDDPKSLWAGSSLFKLYEKAQTPYEWHQAIFERARDHGMIPFSTPFDVGAVDFLEELGASCYKIASFENTDLDLIRRVSATKKPVIISTGMASISELGDTVNAAREAGCENLILLKCTSTYPATPENSNLLTIPHMRELFDCEVGLSDHTLGVGVSVASVALGATVIEKHFTLNRADGGVDSIFSMEPGEMRQLVIETERAWAAMGRVNYGPIKDEIKSLQFRRTLYVTKNLKSGDTLTKDNVRAIRPGKGLPVKYLPIVIGKKINQDIEIGTPLSWKLFG
jgi:pseudaminic acid synthase